MKKIIVRAKETVYKDFIVQANSIADAEQKIREEYEKGNLEMEKEIIGPEFDASFSGIVERERVEPDYILEEDAKETR